MRKLTKNPALGMPYGGRLVENLVQSMPRDEVDFGHGLSDPYDDPDYRYPVTSGNPIDLLQKRVSTWPARVSWILPEGDSLNLRADSDAVISSSITELSAQSIRLWHPLDTWYKNMRADYQETVDKAAVMPLFDAPLHMLPKVQETRDAAAWEAYRLIPPTRGDLISSAFKKAWYAGVAYGRANP